MCTIRPTKNMNAESGWLLTALSSTDWGMTRFHRCCPSSWKVGRSTSVAFIAEYHANARSLVISIRCASCRCFLRMIDYCTARNHRSTVNDRPVEIPLSINLGAFKGGTTPGKTSKLIVSAGPLYHGSIHGIVVRCTVVPARLRSRLLRYNALVVAWSNPFCFVDLECWFACEGGHSCTCAYLHADMFLARSRFIFGNFDKMGGLHIAPVSG